MDENKNKPNLPLKYPTREQLKEIFEKGETLGQVIDELFPPRDKA